MIRIKKIPLIVTIWLSITGCDQSDKQTTSDPNSTNTLESLTAPDNAAQTTSGTLQDIWVIDSVTSSEKYIVNYLNNTPYLNFDLEKNFVSGYMGCNSISAKVKAEGEKLKFDSLSTSRTACKDNGFEKALVKGFKSGNTTYRIQEDRLYLKLDQGTECIFRRIRR